MQQRYGGHALRRRIGNWSPSSSEYGSSSDADADTSSGYDSDTILEQQREGAMRMLAAREKLQRDPRHMQIENEEEHNRFASEYERVERLAATRQKALSGLGRYLNDRQST